MCLIVYIAQGQGQGLVAAGEGGMARGMLLLNVQVVTKPQTPNPKPQTPNPKPQTLSLPVAAAHDAAAVAMGGGGGEAAGADGAGDNQQHLMKEEGGLSCIVNSIEVI